jgi:hypothetical protein
MQLVRQLDDGGALDISGIPDDFLRSRLLTLFSNLVQLRKNSAVCCCRLMLALVYVCDADVWLVMTWCWMLLILAAMADSCRRGG